MEYDLIPINNALEKAKPHKISINQSSFSKKRRLNITHVIEKDRPEEFVSEDAEIKIKSSLNDEDIKLNIKTIDWGEFNTDKLVNAMAEFSKVLTGVTLYPYQIDFQKRIFESVLLNDGDEVTALFSRQAGKSEVVACSIVTMMVIIPVLAGIFPEQLQRFSKGIHIGLFAPTSEQAYTTHSRMDLRLSSDEADALLSDADIDANKRYNGGMLHVFGPKKILASGSSAASYHSFCRMQSAAKQSKVESKTYHVLVMDEAQDIDTLKVEKSLHPMAAAYNGTIIKIGTPAPYVSNFYYATRRNKRNDSKIRNHYEYDYKTVQKYNPFYRAFVKKEIERLGIDSDAFRQAYALEWLLEKGMALTPALFDEYMREPGLKYEYEWDGVSEYAAGLDLAKASDATVLTVAKVYLNENPEDLTADTSSVKTIVNWVELNNTTWEEQFHTILGYVEAYHIKTLTVDGTGVGDPIAERLELALSETECTVISVKMSSQAKHEMATQFYEDLRKHRLRVPASAKVRETRRYKAFLEQFYTAEKVYKNKYLMLQHTDEKGARDDYVDSLLLLLYGVNQNMQPKLTKYNNIFDMTGRYNPHKAKHSQRYTEAIARLKNHNLARWRSG